jgi:hypothetical protein
MVWNSAMTDITISSGCGASRTDKLLESFVVALAHADRVRMYDLLTDDVTWQQIGSQPVVGREAVCRAITRYGPASAVQIEHIVSNARSGAVNGVVEFRRKQRAFCHVFELQGTKETRISAICAYSIAMG